MTRTVKDRIRAHFKVTNNMPADYYTLMWSVASPSLAGAVVAMLENGELEEVVREMVYLRLKK